MTDRLAKLQSLLDKTPADTFLLYAIALEHKKAGEFATAQQWFDRVIATDPAYSVAYHQSGLAHEAAGEIDSARSAYRRGIEAARKAGDSHAAEEMQAALNMIE